MPPAVKVICARCSLDRKWPNVYCQHIEMLTEYWASGACIMFYSNKTIFFINLIFCDLWNEFSTNHVIYTCCCVLKFEINLLLSKRNTNSIPGGSLHWVWKLTTSSNPAQQSTVGQQRGQTLILTLFFRYIYLMYFFFLL